MSVYVQLFYVIMYHPLFFELNLMLDSGIIIIPCTELLCRRHLLPKYVIFMRLKGSEEFNSNKNFRELLQRNTLRNHNNPVLVDITISLHIRCKGNSPEFIITACLFALSLKNSHFQQNVSHTVVIKTGRHLKIHPRIPACWWNNSKTVQAQVTLTD